MGSAVLLLEEVKAASYGFFLLQVKAKEGAFKVGHKRPRG